MKAQGGPRPFFTRANIKSHFSAGDAWGLNIHLKLRVDDCNCGEGGRRGKKGQNVIRGETALVQAATHATSSGASLAFEMGRHVGMCGGQSSGIHCWIASQSRYEVISDDQHAGLSEQFQRSFVV